jgi:hypothetical protein
MDESRGPGRAHQPAQCGEPAARAGARGCHAPPGLLGLPHWRPPTKPKPPPKRQTTPWTANEDRIVRKFKPREAAKLLPRRTLPAVYWRRFALGVKR